MTHISNEPAFEFTVYAKTLMQAKGSPFVAADLMNRNAGYRRAFDATKAAVAAGNTTDHTWAKPLFAYTSMSEAFSESLRSISVASQIEQSTLHLPLKQRILIEATALTGSAVSQGSAIPVTAMSVSQTGLAPRRAVCIVVVSDNLINNWSTQSNVLVHRALQAGVATAQDADFIGVISADAPTLASSGSTAAEIYADTKAMLQLVSLTGNSRLFMILHPTAAIAAATKTTADGLPCFPEMTPNGGMISGIRVLVSDQIEIDTDDISSAILVDASGLATGSENIMFDASPDACLIMDTNPSTGEQQMTSLFQNNSVGIKADRWYGVEVIRDSAVCVLTGVEW